jgi:hypothetical protein
MSYRHPTYIGPSIGLIGHRLDRTAVLQYLLLLPSKHGGHVSNVTRPQILHGQGHL